MNQNRPKPHQLLLPCEGSGEKELASAYLALLGAILSLLTIIFSLLTKVLQFAALLLLILLGSIILIGLIVILEKLKAHTLSPTGPIMKTNRQPDKQEVKATSSLAAPDNSPLPRQ